MKIKIDFNKPIKTLKEMKHFQLAYFFVSNVRVLDTIGDHLSCFLDKSTENALEYDLFLVKLQKLQTRKWLRSYNLKNPQNNIWFFDAKIS